MRTKKNLGPLAPSFHVGENRGIGKQLEEAGEHPNNLIVTPAPTNFVILILKGAPMYRS